MNSEELYQILINFEASHLRRFGLVEQNGLWSLPGSQTCFQVVENRLELYRGDMHVQRLDASIDDPVRLYRTFLDVGLIEPGVHQLNLRNLGLDL